MFTAFILTVLGIILIACFLISLVILASSFATIYYNDLKKKSIQKKKDKKTTK